MKKSVRKIIFVFIFILLILIGMFGGAKSVKADSLSDEISDQMQEVDLSELQEFFSDIKSEYMDFDLVSSVYDMLSGNFDSDYSSIAGYLFKTFFNNIYNILPEFMGLIAIAFLCAIVKSVRGTFLSDNVSETVFFVCFLGEVTLIFSILANVWGTVYGLVGNIARFSEIISPILLTLMVASGGSVTASIFKPALVFFTGGVINILNVVVFPLVALMLIFNVISSFSKEINLNKFSEFSASLIKWILGIIFIVMGLFLSVQGIAGGAFDGLTAKATKYAISNSIPLVGGFLKDSFDLVACGSILIKNAVGISGIIALFYMMISPLMMIAGVSLMLKLCSAFIEPFSDSRISGLCQSVSKTLSYLSAILIITAVMLFITIILMVLCANTALI